MRNGGSARQATIAASLGVASMEGCSARQAIPLDVVSLLFRRELRLAAPTRLMDPGIRQLIVHVAHRVLDAGIVKLALPPALVLVIDQQPVDVACREPIPGARVAKERVWWVRRTTTAEPNCRRRRRWWRKMRRKTRR